MTERCFCEMRDLIRAQGIAMSLIAIFLDRAGVVERREVGGMLALMSAITAETSVRQGGILAGWAAMIEDLDDGSAATKAAPDA